MKVQTFFGIFMWIPHEETEMESHIPVEGSASQALTSKLVIFISHHFVQHKYLTPLLVFTNNQNRTSIYSRAALMYYTDHFENIGVKMD